MHLLKVSSKNRGFTLFELLVTFSIISILTGVGYIAWNKMTKKSKHVEAKTNLSILASAQTQYRQNCAHYYPDLELVGGIPSGKVLYNIGGKHDISEFNQYKGNCSHGIHKCGNARGADCKTDLELICKNFNTFKTDDNVPCYFQRGKADPEDLGVYLGDNNKFTDSDKQAIYPGCSGSCTGKNFNIKNEEFMIFAVGRLSQNLDGWAMDHHKVLVHFQDGS